MLRSRVDSESCIVCDDNKNVMVTRCLEIRIILSTHLQDIFALESSIKVERSVNHFVTLTTCRLL